MRFKAKLKHLSAIAIVCVLSSGVFSNPIHAADYGNAEIPEILDLTLDTSFVGRALRAEATIKIRRNVNALQYLGIGYDAYVSESSKDILKPPCANSFGYQSLIFSLGKQNLISSSSSGSWVIETYKSSYSVRPEPSNINFCPVELVTREVAIVDETGVERSTRIEKICISGCKKLGLESAWNLGGQKLDISDHKNGTWSNILSSKLWAASPSTAKCKMLISAGENKYTSMTVYEGCNQNISFRNLDISLTEAKISEGEASFNRMVEAKNYFDNFVQTEYRDYNLAVRNFAMANPKTFNSIVKPLDIEIKKYFNQFAPLMMRDGAASTNLVEFRKKLSNVMNLMQEYAKNRNKELTITCAKGKVTKKVTGVNPKCPSGYVKK